MTLLFGNADLTSKEWAITALVTQGHTNAQIAAETQTPEQAIESHLRRILEKTGCWSRSEVALWYLKMGVKNERRFCDRREANWTTSGERRKGDRRGPPERFPRAGDSIKSSWTSDVLLPERIVYCAT